MRQPTAHTLLIDVHVPSSISGGAEAPVAERSGTCTSIVSERGCFRGGLLLLTLHAFVSILGRAWFLVLFSGPRRNWLVRLSVAVGLGLVALAVLVALH